MGSTLAGAEDLTVKNKGFVPSPNGVFKIKPISIWVARTCLRWGR